MIIDNEIMIFHKSIDIIIEYWPQINWQIGNNFGVFQKIDKGGQSNENNQLKLSYVKRTQDQYKLEVNN